MARTHADVQPEVPLAEQFVVRLSELARRFLLLTIVGIGGLCGFLAVLFHHFLELARTLLIGRALAAAEPWRTIFVVLTPMLVFSMLAVIIQSLAPRTVGANLARVRMAYNHDPKLLGWRSVVVTFLATPLSLGAGAPLGPEGPIVVVTSGASAAVARILRLPHKLVRGMIPVGVAAGIAAIFNTPITGVVFALEEVLGTSERGLLGGVIVGAVSAAVVERSLLGGASLLSAPFTTWSDPRELLGFAAIGVVAGVTSGYAIRLTHLLKRRWTSAMPSLVARAAVAGLVIGGLGLVAPSILGVGYDSVSTWLHGGGSVETTTLAFSVKIVTVVIAISAGVLGGTFAPSLFMGAALGAAFGHLAQRWFPAAGIDSQAYALLGMGSFFAGLLRSPLAAVLIVIELTRDYDLMVPLMLAVSLSVAVSRRISPLSMVEQQMLDEGYVEGEGSGDPLADVQVAQAMRREPVTLRTGMTVAEALDTLFTSRHRMLPVIDGAGILIGIVRRETLVGAATDAPLADLVEQPVLVAMASERIIDLVERMRIAGADRCPVVDGAAKRLVGFVSPSDILRARMQPDQPFEILDQSQPTGKGG